MPLVSVVMSVYNSEKYVSRAIESILNQTFKDFEFIIINDGSQDNTLDILKEYENKDNRIKIIDQENKGLTKSLNIGIKAAKGKYIARQDDDDVSLSTRFEKQVEYLEKNKEVVLLGTNQYEINGEVETIGTYYDNKTINNIVYLYNPIAHTSAMYRRNVFIEIGLYDESFETSQDFEAWMRLANYRKISMLKDVLVKRYICKDSISSKKKFVQLYNGYRARMKYSVNKKYIFKYTLMHLIIILLPKRIVKLLKYFKGFIK